MSTMRNFFGLCLLLLLVWSLPGRAAEPAPLDSETAYGLVSQMTSAKAKERSAARKALIKAGDPSVAAALVDIYFFASKPARADIYPVLEALLGVKHGSDFKAWIGEIGQREDLRAKSGYLLFKARLFSQIDPAFAEFLDPRRPRLIRPEEIVWGGVKKDGIPALERPPRQTAAEAKWLKGKDTVFGVYLNGEAVAYPHRILDWHEMLNDVVGGVPISLAYCTLCGAGVLYDTSRTGEEAFTFGTSGFLYRSNKLMYDRQTLTLWNQLTGEPAFGPLVGTGGVRLKLLPVVVTTWDAWKKRHPNSLVLSRDTGFDRNYTAGAAYGRYFASSDLMFPVWKQRQDGPGLKEWVWTVGDPGNGSDEGSGRKAYRIDDLISRPILNDRLESGPIVLLTDPESEAVRVFRRGATELVGSGDGLLKDPETGLQFRVEEEALVAVDGSLRYERLPGHRAFWFGVYALVPGVELWQAPVS